MSISRQETSIIKGISILLIVLHNIAHFLPNSIQENEYSFEFEKIVGYWEQIKVFNPQLLLNFFSHYGHYGICAFLFISGYGLVKKYERGNTSMPSPIKFLGEHAVKLWRIMIPALIIFAVCNTYFKGIHGLSSFSVLNLVFFTSNFIPDRSVLLGPWWWFSLIMQGYVVYRLIFWKFRSPNLLIGVTIASLILQGLASQSDIFISFFGRSEHILLYLRHNLIGHLLPFACGIYWARSEKPIPYSEKLVFVTSLVLLLVSSLNIWLWFISPIFAIIATRSLSKLIPPNSYIQKWLIWIGLISPFLFSTHPIVREYIVSYAQTAVEKGQLAYAHIVIIIYLLIACSLAWIMYNLITSLSFLNNKTR